MGLYEMYVLATRADTALMRRRLARSLFARAKLASKSEAQEVVFTQPEGEF